ncbi:MAG: hypothetical protein IKN97_08685 [Lachnospiraceae bacterium]|nr:hypothetical protein [Lachnospiraceae bacterium]
MSDDKEIMEEQAPKEDSKEQGDKRENFNGDEAILAELQTHENEVEDKRRQAYDGLHDCLLGKGFHEAEDGLLAFNMSLTSLVRCGNKNRKLYSVTVPLTAGFRGVIGGDTSEAIGYGKCSSLSALTETVTDFCSNISDMVQNQTIKLAYTMIRIDKELPALSDIYNTIISGFNDYNNLRIHYGNADIIKELKLRKSAAPEANYEIAKKHLDNYIGGTKYLKSLLSAGTKNDLFVIDRITTAFHYIYASKDLMKSSLDTAQRLSDAVLNSPVKKVYLDAVETPVICMNTLLGELVKIFDLALKLIDDYANGSSKPPYAFMHYDLVVKESAERWLDESLPDPLTNGTQYFNLVKAVNKKWDSVLRPIAKNAAKWGLD